MRQSLFLYTNNERGRIPAPSDNSVNLPFTSAYILFLSARSERKSTKKKETAAQNGLSLTAFADDGAANSLRSDAACSRHRQTPYPVFDRSARS